MLCRFRILRRGCAVPVTKCRNQGMPEPLEPGIDFFTFLVVTVGVVNDVDFRHLGDKHPFSRSLLPRYEFRHAYNEVEIGSGRGDRKGPAYPGVPRSIPCRTATAGSSRKDRDQ